MFAQKLGLTLVKLPKSEHARQGHFAAGTDASV